MQSISIYDENNQSSSIKAFKPLERGIKYQIIINHLKQCGSESAQRKIDEYFPIKYDNYDHKIIDKKDETMRIQLLTFCRKFENDEEYQPVSWNKFTKWTLKAFKKLLQSCGDPVIERVAKSRMMAKRRR